MPTTILTDFAQIVMDFALAINAAALQPGMLDQRYGLKYGLQGFVKSQKRQSPE